VLTCRGNEILVTNFVDGVDVYEFPSMAYRRKIREAPGEGYPRQVAIACGGDLVVQGSERGVAVLSDLLTTRKIQDLHHNDHTWFWPFQSE
jgi:hypothetical protein